MTSSTAACDSCHKHSSSPSHVSDQVQGARYFESKVETDAAALQLETSMTTLELETDAADLKLETSMTTLELETDAADLKLETDTRLL
jgi:hypothetical protein